MPSKKDTGKPSQLSEEFVHDSSDDEPDTEMPTESVAKSPNGKISMTAKGDKRSKESVVIMEEPVDESVGSSDNPKDEGNSANAKNPMMEEEAVPSVGPVTPPRKKAKIMLAGPGHILADPYKPPRGFAKLATNASDYASPASELLSSKLAGKQVWHIKAPASVPIQSITSFNLDALRSGKPILTHKEVSYGFSDGSAGDETLLLADGLANDYMPTKTAITRTFHLREIARPVTASEPPESGVSETTDFVPQAKPPAKRRREQPKGLDYTYRPFGVVDVPNGTSVERKGYGKGPTAEMSDASEVQSEKKHKKGKGEHQKPIEDAESYHMMEVDSSHRANPGSTKDSSQAVAVSQESTLHGRGVHGGSERQEKKRRKKKIDLNM